ncbi:hypothetical protein DL98DRAFT_57978 [Cadophora sp. DSE1049]|nr:hypothetical protein DL98DRAFT_57978 [Cadophora sp. DSE1049]
MLPNHCLSSCSILAGLRQILPSHEASQCTIDTPSAALLFGKDRLYLHLSYASPTQFRVLPDGCPHKVAFFASLSLLIGHC